ncbi:hypothetical protein DPMN_142157 [Dreissena polymorpha]|uniref:Uncharacterized protein n=1 Tax=Dreissena polymorpha TaxID=45954 RepID=A0A9D4GAL7_DREPO|nr:hypothetical protein DPMN_142157 [Dreissena polymorpha]
MIIVWIRTCNTGLSLKDLVNKRLNPSNLRWKINKKNSNENGVMFKHQAAKKKVFIWAEYCTYMQLIDTEKTTSAEKHAHGTRFNEVFDEIMSKTSIKQKFTQIKVSLIYFDDRSYDEILTDDTKDVLPEVFPAPIFP